MYLFKCALLFCIFDVIVANYGDTETSTDGVCFDRYYYTRQTFKVTRLETYKKRCYLMFSCKKQRVVYKTDSRSIKNRRDNICCEGYREEAEDRCHPICKQECKNGICVRPDVCQCHKGYSNVNSEDCEPVCDKCSNGVCVSPNTCQCNDGYSNENSEDCEPVCDKCTNGICVSPNTCQCHEGYTNENSEVCEPVCDKCTNGICVSPNTCQCHDGYSNENSEDCEPVCDRYSKWGNGECITMLDVVGNTPETTSAGNNGSSTIFLQINDTTYCKNCSESRIGDSEKETITLYLYIGVGGIAAIVILSVTTWTLLKKLRFKNIININGTGLKNSSGKQQDNEANCYYVVQYRKEE